MLAALVSPSLENVPVCLGSHALSEAVNLAPLSLLGLISPFHLVLRCALCADTLYYNLSGTAAKFMPRARIELFLIIQSIKSLCQALLAVLTGKIKYNTSLS